MRGRGGNDFLHGGTTLWGPVGSDERLYGGAGADRITGGAGDDLLVGGSGNDVLEAYSGADRLLLGRGRDSAHAGPGDDVIHARDGSVDAVYCGRGMDRLRNDPRDYVASPAMCDHHDRSRRLGSIFDFRP
jgi:Ca2+-binding RTX toxin-like protein